jgi:RHS repeat-associated protein
VFQYKDHLGNIRVSYTVDPSDGVLKILDETHYYPFGLKHNGYSATQQMIKGAAGGTVAIVPVVNPGDVTFRYRYSGKEEQDELGLNMYDFGARNYDAAIGRWMNIDPLAEKYYSKTTYNYCANNPMYFTDPDGRSMWAAGMAGSTAGQVTTESNWGKNDMFGRERFNEHGMYIAPNDRSQASAELGEMPGFTESIGDDEPPASFLADKDEEKALYDFFKVLNNNFTLGDLIFTVLGHGSWTHIGNHTIYGKDRYVKTSEQFDDLMSEINSQYKKAIEGKKAFTLYLLVCHSGTNDDEHGRKSVAYYISKAHPNATIYAFDGYGVFGYNKAGKAEFKGISSTQQSNDNKGSLVIYKNGTPTKINSNDYVRTLINNL